MAFVDVVGVFGIHIGLLHGHPLRGPDNNVNEHNVVAGLWCDTIIFCVSGSISCFVVVAVDFFLTTRDRGWRGDDDDDDEDDADDDRFPVSSLFKCLLHNIRSYFSLYIHCDRQPVDSLVVNTVFSPEINLSYSHVAAGSARFEGVLTYFTLHTSGYG